MDWQTLLKKIEEQDDDESRKLLDVLNDQLFKRLIKVFTMMQTDPQ
jgi:hypothetical protein